MLNGRGSQIAIGFLLLAIGMVGVALAVGREFDLRNQPHVVVKVFNVDGTVQVFVGCEQAAVVTTGEARELDLGRMPSDELIFVSVISHDHNPSWSVEAFSNGNAVPPEDSRGYAKALGFETEANAVVTAEAFTAGGHSLGSTGCQAPDLVDRTVVPEYLKSPDESEAPAAKADESPYPPRHFPYDQIDAVGRWSLPVLALLGVIVAFGSTPLRRLARSYGSRIGGTAGFLSIFLTVVTTIAFGVLLSALAVAGVALLFGASLALLFGLEGPAGAGGAEG